MEKLFIRLTSWLFCDRMVGVIERAVVRVVYGGGLENRCGVTPTGGSNPSLPAILGRFIDECSYHWWSPF